MKVLVACEYSGIVREAFKKKGHDAWSCDILPTEIPGQHYQCDVREVLSMNWDLMIAHPPCTYLTVSGNRWMKPEYKNRFPNRQTDRLNAIDFFMLFVNSNIPKWAIENPIGIMSKQYRKPDQIIQPYYFGNDTPKSTCLWLKNLRPLQHFKEDDLFSKKTHCEPKFIIGKRDGKKYSLIHYQTPNNPDRAKIRSKTFQGFADAMAEQWGGEFK